MNSSFQTDAGDKPQETSPGTIESLKDTARERVFEPALEAGRSVAAAARQGAEKVADYARDSARTADRWVGDHPYPTAGLAFFWGIILGIIIGRELRS